MMAEKRKPLRLDDMTEAQQACFALLVDVYGGAHHVPPVYACGMGLKVNDCGGRFATYDFNSLTMLVFAAHDHCVRVECEPSGPGMIGFTLHKRRNRDGEHGWERHPTLEQAVKQYRQRRPAPEEGHDAR